MRAIVIQKYGTVEVLQLREVEKPIPKKNEVLVKVCATAVNDYDWAMMRGKPYLYRLMFGLIRPKNPIPGMELSGVVEALGKEVSLLNKGDEVFGDTSDYGFGSFAEYICVHEKALTRKPSGMSFEEAASIPHAALLAHQGLHKIGSIRMGQKILINGAGGGVGVFGLQIAKQYKAEVTGVDTGEKLEMMKSIGFDQVIDYKKSDFTKNGQRYDLILDAKTNRSAFAYVRSLTPGGTYVTVGGFLSKLLQVFLLGPVIKILTRKGIRILALIPNQGLSQINELFENKTLKCVIDGPYRLEEVAKAVQRFGEGKHTGKVVITLR